MNVSPAGRALIERNEGLRLKAYPDPATGGDPWTIGYGDTGPDVVEGLIITKEDADRRLSNRLAREFEPAVSRAIGSVPTTQNQFDAMVSLAYNIGTGGFKGSTVARQHAAGNYDAAADAFMLWTHAAGRVLDALMRRRGEERALYLSSSAPAPSGPTTIPVLSDAIEGILSYSDFRAGVVAYQQSRGLTADGQIGPVTLRRIWNDMTGKSA